MEEQESHWLDLFVCRRLHLRLPIPPDPALCVEDHLDDSWWYVEEQLRMGLKDADLHNSGYPG